MTITIPIVQDVQITASEFLTRVQAFRERPAHAIGDIVEFIGDYKHPRFGVVVGISLRSGGWFYEATCLTARGTERLSFHEKDVLRGVGV